MAVVSIGEVRWRLLRRLHLAGGAAFGAVRCWRRANHEDVRWMAAAGLLVVQDEADPGTGRLNPAAVLRLTAAGAAVQELGEMEL